MGTNLQQPSQDAEAVEDLFDIPPAVATPILQPDVSMQEQSNAAIRPTQPEGGPLLHNPCHSPQATQTTPDYTLAVATATLNVRIYSTSNGQEISARLATPAKLEDLQSMLLSKFALAPTSYVLTLGAHPLQQEQPLCEQGVVEGSRILLHPVLT